MTDVLDQSEEKYIGLLEIKAKIIIIVCSCHNSLLFYDLEVFPK